MPTDLIIVHTIVTIIYMGWNLILYLYYYYATFWKVCIWFITSLAIGFLGFFFTFMFTGLLSSGSFVNDFCVTSFWIGGVTVVVFLFIASSIIALRHHSALNKSEEILDDSFL
jgi:hypothetical protein